MTADEQRRILLVEDNPDTQVLLSYLLRVAYQVDVVARVDEALAAAEATPYDVLLVDINLGEQRTGIDLLQALRTLPGYADTPVLALTAYAMPGDRERLLNEGFDDYVSKPFTRRDLVRAIQLALGEDDGS